MKIRFDENNRVTGYADPPFDMDGAIEFSGSAPEGFNAETCRFYQRNGDEIVFRGDWQMAEQSRHSLADEKASLENALAADDWKVARQASSSTHKMPDDEYVAFTAERDAKRDRIDEIRLILKA